jgi:hypothetical protein
VRWRRIKSDDITAAEAATDSSSSTATDPSAVDEVAEPARNGSSPRQHPADDTPPAGRPAASLGVELREDYGLEAEFRLPRGRPSTIPQYPHDEKPRVDEPPWAAQPTPRRTNHYGR